MDNIEIENIWRNEINGSPLVQLNNGKWQTWIKIKDKKTDRGRKRFTNINRDNLVSSLLRVINQIKSGKIILDSEELNLTAPLCTHKMLMELQIDLLKEKSAGKKRAISEKINKYTNMLKIYESDSSEHSINTMPLNKWHYTECQKFLDNIKVVSRVDSSPHVNNKYFSELKSLFSYARVKFNIPMSSTLIENFQAEKFVRDAGHFSPSKKARRKALKKLIEFWKVETMQEFFNHHLSYEKNPIWHMALYVLANTGVRCGELFALTTDDFHYSHNGQSTLLISGFVDRNGVRTDMGKNENAEMRKVPIGRGLAEKLKNYIPSIKSSPLIENPDNVLFPQLAGHQNNTGSSTKNGIATFYKACTTKNILKEIMVGKYELPKGLRFHFFRSWVATQWYANEIYNEYEMTKYLGHENIKTTKESYIHVDKSLWEKVNKQDFLDNYLF